MPDNKCSQIIWNAIKKTMKNQVGCEFSQVQEACVIRPTSTRWKNFFLDNSFWAHQGKSQKSMILCSEKVEKLGDELGFKETLDVEEYLKELSNIEFSVYLTDFEESSIALKNRLNSENKDYIIITQKNGIIEEYVAQIVAKLYFIEKGYLVGAFEIPVEKYEIGYGFPDIVGIKGNFVNKLKERGIISNGGSESDILIWSSLKENPVIVNDETEVIVCEVKSSAQWNSAFEQLYEKDGKPRYLKSHCFDKAYACFGVVSRDNELDISRNQRPSAKYEAGRIVFSDGAEPIIFEEDTICSNPSSSRKANSVLVQKETQLKLIDLANKFIARQMISSLKLGSIIPNIADLNVNQIAKKLDKIRVENILDMAN